MQAGIESISFYTSPYYIDLKTLAAQRGEDPDKYYIGIGQERMSVPPPDEDVVTLAANAAAQALQGVDVESIDTIMFATESGIDQSKAAGIYVHKLLNLPKNMRVFELKQACYSGVGGMSLALPYLLHHPGRKVLLIASDIARYGLGSAGEPTQGAGAIAVVLSTDPKIAAFDLHSGMFTNDVMDFWRPNYRNEALVDGKYSIKTYIQALRESWTQYSKVSGVSFDEFSRFAYHLPFVKMGEKAHQSLVKYAGGDVHGEWRSQIDDAAIYQRSLGNAYAASVFIALASTMENSKVDLSGNRIGMFSYGSGSVGEFFSGVISSGYKEFLKSDLHNKILNERTELNYDQYAEFYNYASTFPMNGDELQTPKLNSSGYRFAGVKDHKRIYEVLD
jgi:hydroxymethylglutaryl-CoA synthase